MNNKKTNKNQRVILNGQAPEEPEIFGRSRSREEIRAEIKAEREAERAAVHQQLRAAREQRKAERKTGAGRREIWIISGVLIALVVFCFGLLAWQILRDTANEKYERDETVETYFEDTSAKPDLTDSDEDGLVAAINEAYYTKGGYLCVKLTLGNGADKAQHMTSLEVKLYNTESEALIASGYTASIHEDYTVEAEGYNTYTFYISPDFVKIKDDSLEELTYEITCKGTLIEESDSSQ